MALSWQPFSPYSQIMLFLLTVCVVALLVRGFKDRWQTLGRRVGTRVAVGTFGVLAAVLLGVGAWHPILVEEPEMERAHLVMALDVSDSVLRADGGWPRLRDMLAERLRESIDAVPKKRLEKTTVDLLTFRNGIALAEQDIPLDKLPRAVSALEGHAFASGDGSNLANALQEAGDRIERAGGAGAVLLVSDGNQTEGDAEAQAQVLAMRGVPIHVIPVQSGYPRLGITAIDLPKQVFSGNGSYIRGVLRNSGDEPIQARLEVSRNDGILKRSDHFGQDLKAAQTVNIDDWLRLRQPITFQGFGLQFADVALSDGSGGEHRRRLFTHVNRPPKILAVGGDFRWVAAVGKDAATIVRAAPDELPDNHRIGDFDAVVISAVTADRFAPGVLGQIADLVQTKGMGMFFINGDHGNAREEAHSVLMSYKNTDLAPLLPVHPGPRPFTPDPPPRQIVILVDTSGSMGGDRLRKSQEICKYIIENLLRPKDTLDLMTFTTGVGHLVKRRHMDSLGKEEALRAVNGMKAGGGTDPKEALRLIAHRRMTDCGLIFISDGEFGNVTYRPDCRATVFAIGATTVPRSSPLRKLADPFPVGPDFNPARIKIPYFQPKPRKKYYERETFSALRIERFLREEDTIPMPKIPLPGSAVSHIKAEADLVAVRPKLTDPTLAFMDVGRGRTGVFTSGLSGAWTSQPEGKKAIERWLRELISYTARDRYAFQLEDRGETMFLEISLIPKGGVLPAVDQLTVTLEMEGGASVGVLLRPDPVVPGTFSGLTRIPRYRHAQRAIMRVREVGPDALTRPQLIPALIPAEGLVGGALKGEAYSHGIDEALLNRIALAGGGIFDPDEHRPLLRRTAPAGVSQSLLDYPLIAAFICYLLAFAIRRWDP